MFFSSPSIFFFLISFQEKKNFGCQYVFQTEVSNAATQTTGHYHCSSSEPEECLEVDTNKADETDADWTPSAEQCVDDASPEQMPNNIVPAKERKFVVFESKLNELFQKECYVCGEKGNITKQHIIGTAISVVIDCNCNQSFKWSSQPFSGTMPLGNLIIAGAVMFAGCSISKILILFRHASIQCFSERTYSSIQNAYIVPTITDVWQMKQSDIIDEIRNNGNKVKLGGDARCCSPGHTAKYGSYSIMNLDNNKVVDVQLVQVNIVFIAIFTHSNKFHI